MSVHAIKSTSLNLDVDFEQKELQKQKQIFYGFQEYNYVIFIYRKVNYAQL